MHSFIHKIEKESRESVNIRVEFLNELVVSPTSLCEPLSLIGTWVVWGGGAHPALSRSEDITQDSPMWVLPKPQERPWPNILRDFMFFSS